MAAANRETHGQTTEEAMQMFRRLAILAMFAGGLLPVLSGQSAEGRGTLPGVTGTTRIYYIAADEVDWNYAPAEIDI